jgi:hypothetical protein
MIGRVADGARWPNSPSWSTQNPAKNPVRKNRRSGRPGGARHNSRPDSTGEALLVRRRDRPDRFPDRPSRGGSYPAWQPGPGRVEGPQPGPAEATGVDLRHDPVPLEADHLGGRRRVVAFPRVAVEEARPPRPRTERRPGASNPRAVRTARGHRGGSWARPRRSPARRGRPDRPQGRISSSN